MQASRRANAEEDDLKSPRAQTGEREITSEPLVRFDCHANSLDHAHLE